MKKWNVTVAPEFGDDLRNLHSYIANTLLEPAIAKNLIDRILKAVGTLGELPLRYPLYEKEPWQSRGLRKMSVGNYLVFLYSLCHYTVFGCVFFDHIVLRFFHGSDVLSEKVFNHCNHHNSNHYIKHHYGQLRN